ncbi:MAG: hypothetical protein M3016_06255 [Actinomycetota bacterium]|nr:hypothetical protein [Actinomycetota bacterium]
MRVVGPGRTAALTFAIVLALGVAGLVGAGLTDQRRIAFSAQVPVSNPVAILKPGQSVCQGPISVPAAFDGITAWLPVQPAPSPTTSLTATVTPSAGGGRPASTALRISAGVGRALVWLHGVFPATIASGRAATLCLTATRGGSIHLMGGSATDSSGRLTGRPPGILTTAPTSPTALSLVFLRHPRSLVSMVPTVLTRAALFRPTWMGAWTYWLLLAGLLGATGLLAVALARAADADAGPRPDRP